MNIPIENIPKYKGKEVTHSDMADNIDIRRAIFGAVPEAINQTKKLAPYFKRNSNRETCKAIFDFLKQKLNYVADGDTQMIKLPSALLHSKVGDCKSYSLFTSAILSNLGIPHNFVLVSYNSDPTPSHIYVETDDGCIIDAVWGIFDDEKKPTYRYEVKPNGQMKVKSISGIGKCSSYMGACSCGCNSCGTNRIGTTTASTGKIGIGASENAKEWAIRNGVWYSFSPAKRLLIQANIVNPLMVTARTVMRLMISQNAGGIASMIKKLQTESDGSNKATFKQSSYDGMRNIELKWLEVGGNPNELYDSVKNGASKSPKGQRFGKLLLSASKGNKPNVSDWVRGVISAVFGKRYTGKISGIGATGLEEITAVVTSSAIWTQLTNTIAVAVGAAVSSAILKAVTPSSDEESDGSGDDTGAGTGSAGGSGTGSDIADEVSKLTQTYEGLKPYFDPSSPQALNDDGLNSIYPYLSASGKMAFDKLKKEFGRPTSSEKSNTTTYVVIGAALVGAYFLLKKK